MSADGWCVCGMAANDPTHGGWHKLLLWNGAIYAEAAVRRQREFEQSLAVHDHMRGRAPVDRQGRLDTSDAQSRHGYVVPQR